MVLSDLGEIARVEGDYSTARSLLQQSVAAVAAGGDAQCQTFALLRLGNIAAEERDFALAGTLHQQAMMDAKRAGDSVCLAECLEGRAWAINYQGDLVRSARLVGAANRLRCSSRLPLPAYLQTRYDDLVESLRLQLGADLFQSAWSGGQTMSLNEAIQDAFQTEEP